MIGPKDEGRGFTGGQCVPGADLKGIDDIAALDARKREAQAKFMKNGQVSIKRPPADADFTGEGIEISRAAFAE